MRARKTPYNPSEYSLDYRLTDSITIRLFPGNAHTYQQMMPAIMSTLIADGMSERNAELEAGVLTLAIWTYALWDDPVIEWHAKDDPDDVLLATGQKLVTVGRRLAQELTGPGAMRCGIGQDAVLALAQRALPRAMFGLTADSVLPGEVPPPPSES